MGAELSAGEGSAEGMRMSRGCVVNPIREITDRRGDLRSIRRSILFRVRGLVYFATRVSRDPRPALVLRALR